MAKKVPLVSLTLALLLVTGGAYYLYLSERESYFIDRNFRLLALWSKKISETVDEYKYHFQYMISEFSENENKPIECGKTNPQPECRPCQCQDNVSPENSAEECDCKKDACEKFKCNFKKQFEKLSKNFAGKLISTSVCQKLNSLESNDFVNDQPRIRAQLSSKDKDLLRLLYEKKRQESQQACKDTVKVDLSISKVIRHLVTEQAFDDAVITEEAFSDVIVFDSETGKVHSQENHSLFRIDDFRDVVAQRPDTGGFFSFFSNNSKTADVRNGKLGSSTPPPLKDLLQSPMHRQITIGDISYELFTQPVVLPGLTLKEQTNYRQKKDAPARLILAGLVKTEKFQSEYRAIPHTSLLLFLLFVLLGLLSLPIIHLGLMDHRERLRLIDVLSLLVTCVIGTALITLFFLDVVWLNNVRHNLDDQLKKTAHSIKDKFKKDLEKNLDMLGTYDRSVTLKRDFTCVTREENCPFIYHHACAADDDCTSGGKPNNGWVARKAYPHLCDENNKKAFPYHCGYKLVFWVDPKKNVRINWTTNSEYFLKASVSLAHREYVKRILDSDPKSSLWHTEDGYPAFYAESLHALGTGDHTVVLSMESSRSKQEDPPKEKPKKWVAAIETEFPFLKSAAIPDDTGFAVIEDKGGRVLFHSDDKRSLWENFFEETDNNARLKAHAFSRTEGKSQGRYWGKGHTFYSTPLPGVPWSLVVFRNKELFRTTNFEALLLAGTLFALYTGFSLIVLVIVLAVIWLCNKGDLRKMFMSWFWPDSDRLYWYYTVSVLIFFIVGILWLGVSITPDYAVWFVLFLHPLVSLTGLWSLTKDCPNVPQKISPEQLRRRYAFLIISFLLLFSALPMGIFFKTGADREMTLAMKYNLITMGQKLRQIPDLDFSQIQREIRGINKSRSIDECPENDYWGNSALLQHSIHLNPIAQTMLYVSDNAPSANSPRPSLLKKIHQKIRENSLSRLSNPVSIDTLGLLGDQPPDLTFRWRYDPSPSIALDFQVPSKPGTKWVILRSWPPSDVWWSMSEFPDKRHVLSLIVLIAGVLVLVIVPNFIVSKIFPILREPSTNEKIDQKTQNFLIIGSPKSLESYRPENPPAHQWENIDCRQISDPLEWWKIKRQVLSTRKDGVLLDHFEYQFGVPEFDQAKLELLTRLLAEDNQICVLSTINPLKFARNDDPAPSSLDESKSPAPASLQQWSQVFQSFTLRYTSLDSESVRAEPDAEPHYEAVWQARTIAEKITLHHLARDGFVHAEDPDLPTLFELGLIKSKPDPRWIDDGFEKYVLIAAQRDRLGAIERVKSQSQWHVWKWPLAIVLVVLGIGLISTQEEFHNVVVLVLSILPILLPMLSELIGGPEKDGNAT